MKWKNAIEKGEARRKFLTWRSLDIVYCDSSVAASSLAQAPANYRAIERLNKQYFVEHQQSANLGSRIKDWQRKFGHSVGLVSKLLIARGNKSVT